MIHLGDINNIDGTKIEPVECITFGSPCQDLSVAGLRKGLKHSDMGDEETTRSGLFMEAIRIIKEMRSVEHYVSGSDVPVRYPHWVIWENVPGALSSGDKESGGDFRVVLEELCRVAEPGVAVPRPPKGKWKHSGCILGDGYSVCWRIMDAQWWGVPQRRKRISCVLSLDEQRRVPGCPDTYEAELGSGTLRSAEILLERTCVSGNPEQSITPWKGVARDPEKSSGECDRESEAGSYTLKVRGGVERDSSGKKAGKGALVQTELSGTMAVSQDQTLFSESASDEKLRDDMRR